MSTSKNKVRLSPQLQLGVGRSSVKQNYLKYSAFLFILISAILAGRTIYTIATNSDAPVQVASVNSGQVLGANDPPPASTFTEYTVKKGDTIFNIAQNYNINWATLATLNNLSSPFTLKAGQVLKIPTE